MRPSQDIGKLASDFVTRGKLKGGAVLTRQVMALLDVGESTEADLASYLLFDGSFAKSLIELGRSDAEARKHDIADFFGSASDDKEPTMAQSGEWKIPWPVQ